MSRAYRISVSESVQRHVHVSDGICTALELIDVLDPGSMADLLAAELAQRGYSREQDDGETGREMVRRDADGMEIAIAVDGECAGQVTVRLARDARLELASRRDARIYEEHEGEERQRLRELVARDIERQEIGERARLTDEVTELLEKKLRDLRAELARIANRVTAEALKVRAAQLGEIREISEDPETGSLTIKVRV